MTQEEISNLITKLLSVKNEKKQYHCLKSALWNDEIEYDDLYHYIITPQSEKDKKVELSPQNIYQIACLRKNPRAHDFFKLAATRGHALSCAKYAQIILFKKKIKVPEKFALKYSLEALGATKHIENDTKICVIDSVFNLWFKYLTKNTLPDELDNSIDKFITALEQIKSDSNTEKELQPLYIKAQLLIGKLKHKSGKLEEAWHAYCEITDRTLPDYASIIHARKELLKEVVNLTFSEHMKKIPHLKMAKKKQSQAKVEKHHELYEPLLKELDVSLDYVKYWKFKSEFFHSVAQVALKRFHKANVEKIDKKIAELEKSKKSKKTPKKIDEQVTLLQKLRQTVNDIHDQHDPQKRMAFRRHKAESRFFNPWHFTKQEVLEQLQTLTLNIIEQRFSLQGPVPIELNGLSSRMLITAERVFQEALIVLSPDRKKLGIPVENKQPWKLKNGLTGYNFFGPIENYKIGGSIVRCMHRTEPKEDRLGDSFLLDEGSYACHIYPFLERIRGKDKKNEQIIATYLIRYSMTHQEIILEELQKIYPAANDTDVHRFNRIAFLIKEKEQAQWHFAENKDLQIGMSIAQARALLLIAEGFTLTLKDVFSGAKKYGVYSQSGLINAPTSLVEACDNIDVLFKEYLQKTYSSKCETKTEEIEEIEEDGVKRILVPTRLKATVDSRKVYGGADYSDGEDCETDLDLPHTEKTAMPPLKRPKGKRVQRITP